MTHTTERPQRIELLPCPFCGCDKMAIYFDHPEAVGSSVGGGYYISHPLWKEYPEAWRCGDKECQAIPFKGYFDSENEAAEAYNTRAALPLPNAIELADLLKASAALNGMQPDVTGWQDIATAPKDGTNIIIYREGWDVFPLAWWGEYPGNPVENEAGEDVNLYGWNIECELFSKGMEDGFLGWDEDLMPTMWCPLPTAALTKAAQGAPTQQAEDTATKESEERAAV